MKNKKIIRSLAIVSLVISLFAASSQAEIVSVILNSGTFQIQTFIRGGCNNPNGFPVVSINHYNFMPNARAGFLLDGSEISSNWLKIFQDARANDRELIVYIDNNLDNAYCVGFDVNSNSDKAIRILSITQ